MVNKFPNINSVVNYTNPLYMVQILNILAIGGPQSYTLYIQDMHTFKIIYYRVFEIPVKYIEAFNCIMHFLKILDSSKRVTFVFMKSTPFSSQTFLNLMDTLDLEYSHYKRSEILIIYQTHKLTIKGLILINPDNVANLIRMWNDEPNKLNLRSIYSNGKGSETTQNNIA